MRVKLIIAYDGSSYQGLQVQKETKNTIMGELYRALERIGINSKLAASGRTDAGVHAFRQVLHFDVPTYWENIKKLNEVLSQHLHPSIVIRSLVEVDSQFHARYLAKKRTYRYIVSTKKPNPFESKYITFIKTLDLPLLQTAIKYFIGTHDFHYFEKDSSTETSIRTIYQAKIYQYRGKTIFLFEANGFLRSQIRLIMKFLFEINEGKKSIEDLQEQITLKKRHLTRLAPPNGLYLSNIKY